MRAPTRRRRGAWRAVWDVVEAFVIVGVIGGGAIGFAYLLAWIVHTAPW
jgi:hypothetical protein